MKKRMLSFVLSSVVLCFCFFYSASAVEGGTDYNDSDIDYVTHIELQRKWEADGIVCFQGQAEIAIRFEPDPDTVVPASLASTNSVSPALATMTVFTNRVEGEMKVVINVTTTGALIVSAEAHNISTFGDWGSRSVMNTSASNLIPFPSIEIVQEFSGFNPAITSGTQHVGCGVGELEILGGTGYFGPCDATYDISKF